MPLPLVCAVTTSIRSFPRKREPSARLFGAELWTLGPRLRRDERREERSCGRMLQRAAHDGAHEIAAILGRGLVILHRLHGVGRRFGGGAEGAVGGRLAVERAFRLGNAARMRLGTADADARAGDLAAFQPV